MKLLSEIKQCILCEDVLPFAPRPILQFSSRSRILIIGQAPGIRAHESSRQWNDKSLETYLRRNIHDGFMALPHPSPRNNIWISRRPWFEQEVHPGIRSRVRKILDT